MDKRVVEFRKIAERVRDGRKGGSRPYPDKAKVLAVEYARERVASGESYSAIAAELGIAQTTITGWLEPGSRSFRPVRVATDRVRKRPNRAVLVTPSGVRVEGLSVAEVIRVLGALR